MGKKKPIDSRYKEGVKNTPEHETRWYDNGEKGSNASSARSSSDHDEKGNTSNEHTTKQK